MNGPLTVKGLELEMRRAIPRVIESSLVPPDTLYVMNDLDLDVYQPLNWSAMTAIEKLTWAVENGQTIIVRNLRQMTAGAQQRLVFGRDRDVGVVEEVMARTSDGKGRAGALKSNPCRIVYGEGPEGAVCGDCTHLFRQGGTAGTYYKCELRRNTGGPGTDHRVGWAACGRFEAEA